MVFFSQGYGAGSENTLLYCGKFSRFTRPNTESRGTVRSALQVRNEAHQAFLFTKDLTSTVSETSEHFIEDHGLREQNVH